MESSSERIGPPTDATLKNIRMGKSLAWTMGGSMWCLSMRSFPWKWRVVHRDEHVLWWELCEPVPVRYRRWYWLCFGLAVVRIEWKDET